MILLLIALLGGGDVKCRKLDCSAEAAPQQGYCSREHAPFSNLSNQGPPERQVKAILASGMPVRGEHEKPSLVARSRKDNGMRSGELIRVSASETQKESGDIIVRTETTSMPTNAGNGAISPARKDEPFPSHGWNEEELTKKVRGESGESGTPETETAIAAMSASGVTAETLPVKQDEQSEPSSGAPLISMSLIDDSAKHLFDLMKGIATEAPPAKKYDPHMVNAACNCAKQIYGLMRLKFDVMKEGRA